MCKTSLLGFLEQSSAGVIAKLGDTAGRDLDFE